MAAQRAGPTDPGSDAERRIWAALPASSRRVLEEELSRSDLQTLLLALARRRSVDVTCGQVMRRWSEDRFVRPATIDPRLLAPVEARLWALLPADVAGVELSPVVPLGTCSALGPVSQQRVVTTARLTEVVSDNTNALAIEAATRRMQQDPAGEVHLAACHRVLRAQVFASGAASHFRLFSLVSSAPDTGSARTQALLLLRHLGFWRDALVDLLPSLSPQIHLAVFDAGALQERVADLVLPGLTQDGRPSLVVDEPDRQRGRGYYSSAALRISVQDSDGEVELGDGGLTTWTAQLSSNAKECCLVSCIATERLTDLCQAGPRPEGDQA